MVSLDQKQSGKLPVSAGRGLEGHGIHAGDLTEVFLSQIQHLHGALDRILGLQGVDALKAF